jgi:hypothetical protein
MIAHPFCQCNQVPSLPSLPSLLVACAISLLAARAVAEPVEMELLLAVDVSHSIGGEERELQFEGVADAFRSRRLIDAVTGLPPGGLAIAVMVWAGVEQQQLILPWRVLRTEADCLRFAADLVAAPFEPWPGVTYTAIGAALTRAGAELAGNGLDGRRLVVDLSGDDPGNQGRPPEQARDELVGRGVVVNGLPILTDRLEHEERADLVQYYRDRVAGGPGAFVMAATSFADFRRAITAKLIREISAAPVPAARVADSAASMARNGG